MDSTSATSAERPILTFPRALLLAAAGTAIAFAVAARPTASGPATERWSGTLEDGAQLRIDNVNGAVRVARSPDAAVHIVTTRSARGARPQPLRLRVERHGADVVGCVTEGATCGSRTTRRGGGIFQRLFRRSSSTQVAVVVALPSTARLRVSTVNGSVTVADAARDVELSTVNGSIVVGAAGGVLHASTVNGSVTARLDAATANPVSLETVNGSVTAMLPAGTNGTLAATTVNGRIENDFDPTPVARATKSLSRTLGTGGAPITLSTVNGAVRVVQVP